MQDFDQNIFWGAIPGPPRWDSPRFFPFQPMLADLNIFDALPPLGVRQHPRHCCGGCSIGLLHVNILFHTISASTLQLLMLDSTG